MLKNIDLTQEKLKELLLYDEKTGIFTYFNLQNIAGYSQSKGYRRITVDGKEYLAHRLAWLYVHGVFPQDQIDHINGNRVDNRIENLRNCNSSQNAQNRKMPSINTSGFKGVGYRKDKKKWQARIRINHKHIHIGFFSDAYSAHLAYEDFAKINCGEFYFKRTAELLENQLTY